jgi:rRNA maturation endonuclease Nob1
MELAAKPSRWSHFSNTSIEGAYSALSIVRELVPETKKAVGVLIGEIHWVLRSRDLMAQYKGPNRIHSCPKCGSQDILLICEAYVRKFKKPKIRIGFAQVERYRCWSCKRDFLTPPQAKVLDRRLKDYFKELKAA